MRRITVIEHISLDGIIQGPGAKEEDTSNGFEMGGWIRHYSDEQLGNEIRTLMDQQIDLLLGRRTYDIWSLYWPLHDEIWPNVNSAEKYLVSRTIKNPGWRNTTVIDDNVVKSIEDLKKADGRDLHVWGSSMLVRTLFQRKLVDALKLLIYPLTLGKGKRLFGDDPIVGKYRLDRCSCTSSGVMIADYSRDDS